MSFILSVIITSQAGYFERDKRGEEQHLCSYEQCLITAKGEYGAVAIG